MKKVMLLFSLLPIALSASAQIEWKYVFNDTTYQYNQKILEYTDGNLLVVSGITRQKAAAIAVKKLSSDGELLWEKYFTRPFVSIFGLIILSSHSAIIMTDRSELYGYEFLKINSDGDSIMSMTYGVDSYATSVYGVGIAFTTSHFIYGVMNVSGVSPFNEPYGGYTVFKLDTNGTYISMQMGDTYTSNCVSGNQPVYAGGISAGEDDHFWLSYSRIFGNGPCVPYRAIALLDNNEDSVLTYHIIGDAYFNSLASTNGNGCLMVENTPSTTTTLIKLTSGAPEWSLDLQGKTGLPLQAYDNNYILASNGFEIRKVLEDGNPDYDIWLNTEDYKISGFIQVNDSGYVLTGTAPDSLGIQKIVVEKTVTDKLLSTPETRTDHLTVSIHPNPFNTEFTIAFDKLTNKDIQLKIYNAVGSEINDYPRTFLSNSVSLINLQSFSSGLYIVQIISEDETIGIQKLIKQ